MNPCNLTIQCSTILLPPISFSRIHLFTIKRLNIGVSRYEMLESYIWLSLEILLTSRSRLQKSNRLQRLPFDVVSISYSSYTESSASSFRRLSINCHARGASRNTRQRRRLVSASSERSSDLYAYCSAAAKRRRRRTSIAEHVVLASCRPRAVAV